MSVYSIGGSDSILSMLYNQSVQNGKSPEETFSEIDEDSSETIDSVELTSLTDQIESDFGIAVDADEAISSWDTDGDSELSQSELDTMMTELMQQFGVSTDSSSMDSTFMSALSSYADNSGSSSEISSFLSELGAMAVPPQPSEESAETTESGEEEGIMDFDELDINEDGYLSEDEVAVLTDDIASATGIEMDGSDYDEDGDGVLSEDELSALMSDLRDTLGPPPESDESAETMADVFSSYLENADEETLSGLIEVISQYVTSTSSSSGIDVEA